MDIGEGGTNVLYTTVEGFIKTIKDKITDSNKFPQGDTANKHNSGVNDKVNDGRTGGGGDPNSSANPDLRRYGKEFPRKYQLHGRRRGPALNPDHIRYYIQLLQDFYIL